MENSHLGGTKENPYQTHWEAWGQLLKPNCTPIPPRTDGGWDGETCKGGGPLPKNKHHRLIQSLGYQGSTRINGECIQR